MVDENKILVTVDQRIMSITFNRPEKKNALTDDMYQLINEAMIQADSDVAIRVVLFKGNGDSFTAGNDIADFLNTGVKLQDKAVVKMLTLLEAFKKPLVAAVQGNAIGIGTTLLLHCDLVVAAKNTIFSMPFVPLGLCPEAASSMILPQLAGHQQAAELLMLGEPFNVEKAERIGFINRIVDTENVQLEAMALCQKLAALPSRSVILTKQLLKTPCHSVKQRMAEEFSHFEELLSSDDAKKTFHAFLNR